MLTILKSIDFFYDLQRVLTGIVSFSRFLWAPDDGGISADSFPVSNNKPNGFYKKDQENSFP
jgi:hypothetical protein